MSASDTSSEASSVPLLESSSEVASASVASLESGVEESWAAESLPT